ncbi:MAG TPA: DinB family protein [Trueperaceae bacterium]|nr:DinB family protein [Trueperaceae bacterium]
MRFEMHHAMEILGRTPPALTALLEGLSDEWLGATEGPGTFSPFDVVGHLIDGERTGWMVRARLILSGAKDTPFEPYDRYGHREHNRERGLTSLLAEFARLRATNLQELAAWNLTDEQLAMTGTHSRFGSTPLTQLLSVWVVHDLGHIAQVARVMAKQYGDVIGPWSEFLPVVTDRPTPVT